MRTRPLLVLILSLSAAPAVQADAIFPLPGPERIALADLVAVVRVVGLEAQDVEVKGVPGAGKYRVAAVAMVEPLMGAKAKMLRVGFPTPPETGKAPRPTIPQSVLKPGQIGLLFARQVPGQNLYIVTQVWDFISRPLEGQPQQGLYQYAPELDKTRQQARLLANPVAGLSSKNAGDRLQTAVLLVIRYRTPPPGKHKLEPISADETKRILTALTESDWRNASRDRRTNPWSSFNLLGLTAKDGWTPPRSIRDVSDLQRAARAWFRDHGAKYRIHRYVLREAKSP